MASSPIVADDKVVLVCDQDSGSFMVAIDRNSGHVVWKIDRPEYTRGFATPSVHRPADGPPETDRTRGLSGGWILTRRRGKALVGARGSHSK